jgi:hypothetical protein
MSEGKIVDHRRKKRKLDPVVIRLYILRVKVIYWWGMIIIDDKKKNAELNRKLLMGKENERKCMVFWKR